jgi:hypothetical protein
VDSVEGLPQFSTSKVNDVSYRGSKGEVEVMVRMKRHE